MGHQNGDVNGIHKLACVLLMRLFYIYIYQTIITTLHFQDCFLNSPSDILYVLSLGNYEEKSGYTVTVNPHRVDVILLFYNQDLPRTLIYL